MSCFHLLHTREYACQNPARKYVQKVVWVSKSDVPNYKIYNNELSGGHYGIQLYLPLYRHSLQYNPNGNVVFGSFQKSVKNNLTCYKHQIQIAVFDVSEQTKVVLRSLDKVDYFALLEYQNGLTEVYGFHNGLITANYNYDPANNSGGGLLTLESLADEHTMPYILCNNNGTPIKNFVSSDSTLTDLNPINEIVRFGPSFNTDFFRMES